MWIALRKARKFVNREYLICKKSTGEPNAYNLIKNLGLGCLLRLKPTLMLKKCVSKTNKYIKYDGE
jgi:hypothetical protein